MKFLIYIEVLISSALFLIYSLIKIPILFIINSVATVHRTADFYSLHGIHFFEPTKARKIYEEEMIKELNKTYGEDNGKR